MASLEVIDYLLKAVGLITLLRIAHNTGQISEKIKFHEKSIGDHEIRLRDVEKNKSNKSVTHFVN
jgi:hypothetical protein